MTETSSRNSGSSARSSLGKRIFSRTTDAIAISIILFAGISMGGAVLEWWRTTPEEAYSRDLAQSAEDVTPPEWGSGPMMMDAGNLNVRFQRQEWTGTKAEAHNRMIEFLVDRVNSGVRSEGDPDEKEEEMLQAVKSLKPVWEDDQGLQIFHHDAPLAVYVAVRPISSEVPNPSQNPRRRVVSWGFVVTTSKDRWTAWLMTPHGTGEHRPADDWRSVLPEEAICDLGLHSEDRHLMMSFSGNGTLIDWKREFESSLAQRKFRKLKDWSDSDRQVSAEFSLTHPTQQQSLTIQIQKEAGGRLRGLMHVSPPREETP